MSTIPLHIMLHGLIALVPVNGPDGANHMTALLVDARQPPPGIQMDCFAEHVPSLRVRTATPAECQAAQEAGCSADGEHCKCQLVRKEISMTIEPGIQLAMQRLRVKPPTDLPFDQRNADDFSYIANMTQPPLNRTLDRRFTDSSIPPDALIARMTFPFESARACALGTRRDEGSNNVHPMGFRPLHILEKQGDESRALAQQFRAELQVPAEATITVTISDFGGANPRTLTLVKEKGTGSANHVPGESQENDFFYMIELLNMRQDLDPDDTCEDGIARDFAFFYELVVDPPDWAERPIPHIKYTRWKSVRDVEIPECLSHLRATPTSRPICPMGSFNPSTSESQ